jgi:hypothetical protein
MGEAKYTPGPWQMDEGNEVHKNGTTIFAWPEWSGTPDDEQLANMELGRAAPDLLAALEEWALHYEGWDQTQLRIRYSPELIGRINRTRAAIAKAKGTNND